MRVAMIGAGYVGLVSGACFADFGHEVICVDCDPARIALLKSGKIPIFEPGLDAMVAENVSEGRLRFTTDLAACVTRADVVFIAVGTPSRRGDGHADLSYVYAAARNIACHVKVGAVIVTKSTVPVGTGDEIERILCEVRPDIQASVASNPEFLREGAAIEDFKSPDRIVIGCEDDNARSVMRRLYQPHYSARIPLIEMSRCAAELTKYAANAFLATKITFINEIADLCEKVGADVGDVAHGIGLDHRIGGQFLNAGPGYGGSCLPKDTLALIKTAQDHDVPLRIIATVAAVNENRKHAIGRKIIAALGGDAYGSSVAILGLTFKADTDDMRDAPSIAIIQTLQDHGATINAFDPKGEEQARLFLKDVTYFDNPYDACRGAAAAVVVTDWAEVRAIDLGRLREVLSQPNLIDLRNVFAPKDVVEHGLNYHGVGRSSVITRLFEAAA